MQENEFSLALGKLKELLGVSERRDVRRILREKGISSNTFDGWEKRGRITRQGLVLISEKIGEPVERIRGIKNAEERDTQREVQEVTEMRIASLLLDAEAILRSKSPFASALWQNIDSFKVALNLWQKSQAGPQRLGAEDFP